MKIYRNAENLAETHGTFEIELTAEELTEAFREQQHIYDIDGEFCDTCDYDILSDTCKHNK